MRALLFQQSNLAIESNKNWRAGMHVSCLNIWGMLKLANFSKEIVTGKRISTHIIHPLDAATSISNLHPIKKPHKKIRNKHITVWSYLASKLLKFLRVYRENWLQKIIWKGFKFTFKIKRKTKQIKHGLGGYLKTITSVNNYPNSFWVYKSG